MIEVHRGHEPLVLANLRPRKLRRLRALIVKEGRLPESGEINGYRIVAEHLWRAQKHKCCYCERVIECNFYDVEHYRPKAGAHHGPFHPPGNGYWYLAFTWENLLFSCKGCNEGNAKGIQFPLTADSIPLKGQEQPPRGERPLLIDPARECGIGHIRFRLWQCDGKWRPEARDGSEKGRETIRVCQLDRNDLLDLYTSHVDRNVREHERKVRRALNPPGANAPDVGALREAVRDANVMLLRKCRAFVALSYDALQHFIPDARLMPYGLAWRRPA